MKSFNFKVFLTFCVALFLSCVPVVARPSAKVTTCRRKAAEMPGILALFNDASRVETLQKELEDILAKTTAITNKAESENRDLTDDEISEIDELNSDFDRVEVQLKALNKTARMSASAGRRSAPAGDDKDGKDGLGDDNFHQFKEKPKFDNRKDGKNGFDSFGEFCIAVRNACHPEIANPDPRLQRLQKENGRFSNSTPTTWAQESVGEDGGFTVPVDFREEIMKKVMNEDSLMNRCDVMTTSRNQVEVPQDNVTPWDNSNGIQAYWEGEADQFTQSKPKLDTKSQRLHKLTALVPVTDELLEDSTLMSSYIGQKAPEKMDFKISRAILAGTGVGQPLGLWNSNSTITVDKEAGQAADTLVFENLVKMYARMYSGCMARGIWIANQDILPQLMNLEFPTSAAAVPVYLPPGGLSAAPYGTILGRPIVYHEAAETLGDKGDLTFVDLNKYLILRKAAGIEAASSMHLYFDYQMTAFRFVFRMSGSSWWKDPVQPRSQSGNTLGCAVTLAERA